MGHSLAAAALHAAQLDCVEPCKHIQGGTSNTPTNRERMRQASARTYLCSQQRTGWQTLRCVLLAQRLGHALRAHLVLEWQQRQEEVRPAQRVQQRARGEHRGANRLALLCDQQETLKIPYRICNSPQSPKIPQSPRKPLQKFL